MHARKREKATADLTRLNIDKWLICISGFLQTEGTANGVVKLWRRLRKYAEPTCCVELRSWNDNWNNLAELIWRTKRNGKMPDVRIFAYSWGGQSSMTLARQLARRGLSVRHMVLSDPVYRPWCWLGRWRAMLPLNRIMVPSNVAEVRWFRQTQNWPRGHDLKAEDTASTIIADAFIEEAVSHSYMDDLDDWHTECDYVSSLK